MKPALTPSESTHRSNALACSMLVVETVVALALATAVCVVAPPLVGGLAVVFGLGPLYLMTMRAERLERASAPRQTRPLE